MNLIFALFAGLTTGAAVAALSLRNLVHASLWFAVSVAGLALLYLELGVEFAAFTQVLVYLGAVSILIVFTVLLTRGNESQPGPRVTAPYLGGFGCAVLFVFLARAILTSRALPAGEVRAPVVSVKMLGDRLLTVHVVPLEVLGLLLTAALLGAATIALREPADGKAGAP